MIDQLQVVAWQVTEGPPPFPQQIELPHTPVAQLEHFCPWQSTHQWPPQHCALPDGGAPRHPVVCSVITSDPPPPSSGGSASSSPASVTK
jgi:hypothetical protein